MKYANCESVLHSIVLLDPTRPQRYAFNIFLEVFYLELVFESNPNTTSFWNIVLNLTFKK